MKQLEVEQPVKQSASGNSVVIRPLVVGHQGSPLLQRLFELHAARSLEQNDIPFADFSCEPLTGLFWSGHELRPHAHSAGALYHFLRKTADTQHYINLLLRHVLTR